MEEAAYSNTNLKKSRWLLHRSDWMCKMIFWYGLVGRCSSYAFIIIVTLQRCIAITLPLKQMNWMSVSSAKTKIIPLVVVFNILYSSYTVFLTTRTDPGKFGCTRASGNHTIARIGLVMTLVIDIAIPFTTISVLNTILISAIRQKNRNFDSFCEGSVSNRPSTESVQRKSQQEGRQLTLTLIFVCVAFLLLASPVFLLLAFFTFVNKFTSPKRFAIASLLNMIVERLLHINAGINCWLYCAAGKKFSEDLKLLLGWSSSSSLTAENTSTNSSLS